jgi:hypothetical protein
LGGVGSPKGDGALKVDGGDEQREGSLGLPLRPSRNGFRDQREQTGGTSLVRDGGTVAGWSWDRWDTRGTVRVVGLLAVHNGLMTSTGDDELRDEVLRLSADADDGEGPSIRAIAKRLGLSRMKVQRILAAAADDDDEESGLALLDGSGGYEAVGPFEFVGMAEAVLELPGCDGGQLTMEPRFVDANGRSASMLDIYRADFADGSEGRGLMADAGAQIEAAGYHGVSTGDGRWRWAGG